MDTMTHPDFQRRGLFVRLAELTYDEVCASTGRCDLVGIPGATSLPGFTRKLGWSEIHRFNLLTAPALLVRATPRSPGRDVSIETIDQLDERVRELLLAVRELAGDAWPRLAGTFFDWRVFGHSPNDFVLRWRPAAER
jgi:hypothetical protein